MKTIIEIMKVLIVIVLTWIIVAMLVLTSPILVMYAISKGYEVWLDSIFRLTDYEEDKRIMWVDVVEQSNGYD